MTRKIANFAKTKDLSYMDYSIYCDETCHLEHDNIKQMALGAVWCPSEKRADIFKQLRELKVKHGLKPNCELKWNAVSPSKIDYYLDVVDYFFANQDLHFRAVVIPDKSNINLQGTSHDSLYYKLYFDLLKTIIDPKASYEVYLDIKDTRGQKKVNRLKAHLNESLYDFDRDVVKKIQQVRSHEVELVELSDFMVGAVCYANRGLTGSQAKLAVIAKIREKSGYNLLQSTLYKEDKVNIYIWKSRNE